MLVGHGVLCRRLFFSSLPMENPPSFFLMAGRSKRFQTAGGFCLLRPPAAMPENFALLFLLTGPPPSLKNGSNFEVATFIWETCWHTEGDCGDLFLWIESPQVAEFFPARVYLSTGSRWRFSFRVPLYTARIRFSVAENVSVFDGVHQLLLGSLFSSPAQSRLVVSRFSILW